MSSSAAPTSLRSVIVPRAAGVPRALARRRHRAGQRRDPVRARGRGERSLPPIRLSFVCLGNICRSPTAEAVMRHLVREAASRIGSRSTAPGPATGTWVSRAIGAASRWAAGGACRSSGTRAAVQADGLRRASTTCWPWTARTSPSCERLAPDPAARAKVHLLRAFDPEPGPTTEVPDPYYGGADGFERVFDICDAGLPRPLAHLRRSTGCDASGRWRGSPAPRSVALALGVAVNAPGRSRAATSTTRSRSTLADGRPCS